MHAGRLVRIASSAAVTLAALGPAAAEGIVRYQGVVQGGIVATGNSLGLSKAAASNAPGLLGSIGAFLATSTSSTDGSYPAGTTDDWTLNGSSAVLDLPADAEVLYAELVWGGSYDYGDEDVSGELDDAPVLRIDGASHTATPDEDTALTLDAIGKVTNFQYYVRSAEVTEFVAAQGGGTYRLSKVPATQDDNIDTLNAAGWALFVVVREDDGPTREVRLSIGGGFVEGSTAEEVEFEGLCPAGGDAPGRILVAALEGDAAQTGDQVLVGETLEDLVELTGPNNFSDNFFASQINDADGELDTRGSMGDRNHDAENATNVSGGRQGWDLTAVALEDGSVAAGQETLAIQIASTDDAIVTAVVAAELAVDAPRFPTATPTLFPESVQGLAPATITLALTNDGALAADDVLLEMDLPEGIAVTAFAIDGQDGDAFGGSVVAEDFVDGVAIGTIEAGEDATITIELTSEIDGTFELAPTWTYEYVACVGDSPTTGRGSAEPVSLTVTRRDGGDDDDDGGGGCGCRTGGEPAAGGLLALGLLGLVRALTRRSA